LPRYLLFRLPFLVEGNGFLTNWLALGNMAVEFMLIVNGQIESLADKG
jgi:hypothetical protein